MNENEIFINAVEEMNIEKLMQFKLTGLTHSSGYPNEFSCLEEAFAVLRTLGNTQLNSSNKFLKSIPHRFLKNDQTYRYKFIGNHTSHHLSLYLHVVKNRICKFYDVIDIKKGGCFPIDNMQILTVSIENIESQMKPGISL